MEGAGGGGGAMVGTRRQTYGHALITIAILSLSDFLV